MLAAVHRLVFSELSLNSSSKISVILGTDAGETTVGCTLLDELEPEPELDPEPELGGAGEVGLVGVVGLLGAVGLVTVGVVGRVTASG